MPLFLAVQSTYTDVTLALYRDAVCYGLSTDSHKNASSLFINNLDTLLRTHNVTLADLDFITVNAGPGPFTTLRTVISTLNGLSFAQGTPLVPLNGLELFLQSSGNNQATYNIALMNAFCNDVYFGILTQATQKIITGVMNIDDFLQEYGHLCQSTPYTTTYFMGNGVELYKDKLAACCGIACASFSDYPITPPIDALATRGLQQWKQKSGVTHYMEPLYLKPYSTRT